MTVKQTAISPSDMPLHWRTPPAPQVRKPRWHSILFTKPTLLGVAEISYPGRTVHPDADPRHDFPRMADPDGPRRGRSHPCPCPQGLPCPPRPAPRPRRPPRAGAFPVRRPPHPRRTRQSRNRRGTAPEDRDPRELPQLGRSRRRRSHKGSLSADVDGSTDRTGLRPEQAR